MSQDLNVNISAHLDIDEETLQNIYSFTKALERLPREVSLNVSLDGKFADSSIKFNVGDLLIEQVKQHFNKQIKLIHTNV